MFDDRPSKILGRDRRILLHKIKQYKFLFKKELASFKLKKNPTLKDLEDGLSEIESILELDTINSFIIEPFYRIIEVSENIISNTFSAIDIRGLCDS